MATTISTERHDDDPAHSANAGGRRFRRAWRGRGEDPIGHDEVLKLLTIAQRLPSPAPRPVWALIGALLCAAIPATFALILYVNGTVSDRVKTGVDALDVRIGELDKRLDARLALIEKMVERIGTTVERGDGRLGTIELRLERMDSRLK